MYRLMAVLCLVTLAACGADGPPETPTKAATPLGLSVSGQVEMGVARDGG